MKLIATIGLLAVIGAGLTGCAAPDKARFMYLNDDSKRISSIAQVAKDSLEDCRVKGDKNACDDVGARLDEIITISNDGGDNAMRKR